MFVGEGVEPQRREVSLMGHSLGARSVTQSARFLTWHGVCPNVPSTEGGKILTNNLFDRCAEGCGRRTDAATWSKAGPLE